MSKEVQIRRGTADQHLDFTGKIGEITMDTTNNTLRVHDGETVGGTVLAKQATLDAADYVIETQTPSASNNYTWFRKYKSGWVEQGGIVSIGNLANNNAGSGNVSLAIAMADSDYSVITTPTAPDAYNRLYSNFGSRSTSGFSVAVRNIGGDTKSISVLWRVCGQSA